MRKSLTIVDGVMVSQTLIQNADFFTWTVFDMPRVSPDIITHQLLVYKEARPIAQIKKNG